MPGRDAIRPPRRPTRFRALAALRYLAFAFGAVALAALLMKGAMTYVVASTRHVPGPRRLWFVQVTNRSPVPAESVKLSAIPVRGGFALDEADLGSLRARSAGGAWMEVSRACEIRVELTVGGTRHTFSRLARMDPVERDDVPELVIGMGPLVNGEAPD